MSKKKTYKITKINDPIFDKFLKNNKAKKKFIDNCNRFSNDLSKNDKTKLEKINVRDDIISESIIWSETIEGHEFWSKLNVEFIKFKNN